MDSFDMKPERRRSSGLVWNILTGVVFIGIICLGIYFMSVFINPSSSMNPFPPGVLPTLVQSPTPTPPPLTPPPTWTPSPTIAPSPSRTEASTWTPIPSNTPYVLEQPTSQYTLTPGVGPTHAPTNTGMPVSVTVNYLDSTIYHPEAGCNWFGVAGQAVDRNNNPILYLTVHIFGTLSGGPVDKFTLTGTAPNYGQSGFEIFLGNQPIASDNMMFIQLLDQANLPLTEKVSFDTAAGCEENLIMVQFRKTR